MFLYPSGRQRYCILAQKAFLEVLYSIVWPYRTQEVFQRPKEIRTCQSVEAVLFVRTLTQRDGNTRISCSWGTVRYHIVQTLLSLSYSSMYRTQEEKRSGFTLLDRIVLKKPVSCSKGFAEKSWSEILEGIGVIPEKSLVLVAGRRYDWQKGLYIGKKPLCVVKKSHQCTLSRVQNLLSVVASRYLLGVRFSRCINPWNRLLLSKKQADRVKLGSHVSGLYIQKGKGLVQPK